MALRHRIAEEHRRALPPAAEHHELDPQLQDIDAGMAQGMTVTARLTQAVVQHGRHGRSTRLHDKGS
jgi:hypothetical protein